MQLLKVRRIVATADGEVIASAYGKYNGNYVKIRHNSTYTTQYLHMSKRAVKNGAYVRQGDLIGYVGSTGLATGPHVCYRFWVNGKQVDPYQPKPFASVRFLMTRGGRVRVSVTARLYFGAQHRRSELVVFLLWFYNKLNYIVCQSMTKTVQSWYD